MSQWGFISEGEALIQERLASCRFDKSPFDGEQLKGQVDTAWSVYPTFSLPFTWLRKEAHYKNDQEYHSTFVVSLMVMGHVIFNQDEHTHGPWDVICLLFIMTGNKSLFTSWLRKPKALAHKSNATVEGSRIKPCARYSSFCSFLLCIVAFSSY